MSLTLAARDCKLRASFLGDYQSMSVDELANGYCRALDEEDEELKQNYMAALLLRFWYTIDKMYQKTKTVGAYEKDDFFGILYERINYACKYRKWQEPDSKINAQACINMAIATEVKNIFYFSNLDKNKVNTAALTVSLETPLDDEDGGNTLMDTIAAQETVETNSGAEDLVQQYINKKQPIEAIILDTIAFNDVEKVTKETVKGVDEFGEPYKYIKLHTEFWPYKCVQILSQLPEDYSWYFSNKYNIPAYELEAAINQIRKSNNQKLYKYLDKTLQSAKTAANF